MTITIEVPGDGEPTVRTFETDEQAEQWAAAQDAHQTLAEQANAAQQAMRG